MAMTDEERIRMMSMPEGRLETPEGTIWLKFMKPDCILAVAGRDTGWLRIDGEAFYAVARIVYEDTTEEWVIHEREWRVDDVRDGKAADPAPSDVRDAGLSLLLKATTDWLDANPDLLPRADLAEANGWVFKKEDDLLRLEQQIEAMRQELRDAREERDAAQAELDAVLAASGTPSP